MQSLPFLASAICIRTPTEMMTITSVPSMQRYFALLIESEER